MSVNNNHLYIVKGFGNFRGIVEVYARTPKEAVKKAETLDIIGFDDVESGEMIVTEVYDSEGKVQEID